MGDVGDYWNDHREYKREKRAKQMESLGEWLKAISDAGLPCVAMDRGSFYRVDGRFDWWPTTGTWMSLDKKVRGHGVRNLIRRAKGEK